MAVFACFLGLFLERLFPKLLCCYVRKSIEKGQKAIYLKTVFWLFPKTPFFGEVPLSESSGILAYFEAYFSLKSTFFWIYQSFKYRVIATVQKQFLGCGLEFWSYFKDLKTSIILLFIKLPFIEKAVSKETYLKIPHFHCFYIYYRNLYLQEYSKLLGVSQ